MSNQQNLDLDGISEIVEPLAQDLRGPTRKELARCLVDVPNRIIAVERRLDVFQNRVDGLQHRIVKAQHHGNDEGHASPA